MHRGLKPAFNATKIGNPNHSLARSNVGAATAGIDILAPYAHELLKALEVEACCSCLRRAGPLPANAIIRSRLARHPVKSKNRSKGASTHPPLLKTARVCRTLSSATDGMRLRVSNFAGVAGNDTSRRWPKQYAAMAESSTAHPRPLHIVAIALRPRINRYIKGTCFNVPTQEINHG